ncbi:MAG: DUF551 domain-containing protein [Clostridiales bacterium]|nr:DUF551 domain-containing protein [Clostridiales bacterium]MBQ1431956.1 DUF551 domain-containing protein [Ruminococcus sp.]MBQ1574146.1 DUF551 domain-containing protein [Clostridiales bacterium]
MSEYIKISDVIKICKHLYSSFVTTAFFDTHVLAFENLLRTVAVEFPEPPESKEYCMSGWISVKDRLPEKSGIYLVYGNRGNGKTAIDTADFAVYQGYFSLWNFDVTHWMPLPQEPESE